MSNGNEDICVFNGHFELEIVIDRPIGPVWTQCLDSSSWVTNCEIEHAYGTPGTLGAIVRVFPKDESWRSTPAPHHHYCKLVKLLPEKQYVLKSYSERGGSYGLYITAYDDTRFIEINDKTKVVFNTYAEIRGEAVAKSPSAMTMDMSRDGMIRNLENLKRVAEKRR